MQYVDQPQDEEDLLSRAQKIAGMTLAELADRLHAFIPDDLNNAKGWQGQLLEAALGATAGNQAKPDFFHLGIELKSIPVQHNGTACETTYICTAPMMVDVREDWHSSRVYKKLSRVLWIPIEGNTRIELPVRRIGMPLLWSPTRKEEQCLQNDWEELMELLTIGKLENITAHQGVALQLRPKAANSKVQTTVIDAEGNSVKTTPRGFYLRTTFTNEILRKSYVF